MKWCEKIMFRLEVMVNFRPLSPNTKCGLEVKNIRAYPCKYAENLVLRLELLSPCLYTRYQLPSKVTKKLIPKAMYSIYSYTK